MDKEQQEYFDMGYDKGRWQNPNFFEVLEANYFKRMEADKKNQEAELSIKVIYVDKVSALEKEIKEVKDKYIKLLEKL